MALKFISWNVNGLRAVAGKGFKEIFEQLDAGLPVVLELCRQERL